MKEKHARVCRHTPRQPGPIMPNAGPEAPGVSERPRCRAGWLAVTAGKKGCYTPLSRAHMQGCGFQSTAHSDYFRKQQKFVQLILCGSKSSRMSLNWAFPVATERRDLNLELRLPHHLNAHRYTPL